MLTREASIPLFVVASDVDRALPLDETPPTFETAYFGGIEIIMCT